MKNVFPDPDLANPRLAWDMGRVWAWIGRQIIATPSSELIEHSSANNGFVFDVEKQMIISGVIFDVESDSEIRISLPRQDFEIFEVMCSKNGVFRYFGGYVQGARNFFGFFLECHHLALLFPFRMSYWTVTSDFFSQRYGEKPHFSST